MNRKKINAVHDYLAGIGRRGGLSTSPSKSAASRANGAKGGRPRKPRCTECTWFNSLHCPLTATSRSRCYSDRGFDNLASSRPCFVSLFGSSRAEPASLKQSRTGRCKPASSGSRPSKQKNRP